MVLFDATLNFFVEISFIVSIIYFFKKGIALYGNVLTVNYTGQVIPSGIRHWFF